jgi:hypothetical protein
MDSLRQRELEELGVSARWLAEEKSRHAFDYACSYLAPSGRALSENRVSAIRKHKVQSHAVACAWVKDCFPANGTVQLVFSQRSVCVIATADFVEHWINMFCPSRDDVLVIHDHSPAVLYYHHEDELTIGERCA